MTSRSALALAILIALAPAPGDAGQGTSAPPAVEIDGIAGAMKFSGRPRIDVVVVAVDGTGLSGVGLSLCPTASERIHVGGDDTGCLFELAGSGGSARFKVVPPGEYRLTAELTGFAETMIFPLSIAGPDPLAPDKVVLVMNAVLQR